MRRYRPPSGTSGRSKISCMRRTMGSNCGWRSDGAETRMPEMWKEGGSPYSLRLPGPRGESLKRSAELNLGGCLVAGTEPDWHLPRLLAQVARPSFKAKKLPGPATDRRGRSPRVAAG